MTLYELKEKMATVGAQIKSDAEWIAEKAANPEIGIVEIDAKKEHRDELQKRFNLLKAEHDELELEQKTAVSQKNAYAGDEKMLAQKGKGEFYRAVLLGREVNEVVKAYQQLGAIPALDADLGYGSKLLPSTMSNELIVEPMVENPMRTIVRTSSITGLEEPKLLFDLGDGYDEITDKETAKEIKVEGDTVTYGRHKVKVRAKVSDTIIHGSPINISGEIDNALRAGLAANEMKRMFESVPAPGYEEMSFYSAKNAIKTVEGVDLQDAIASALADLPIAYRRNAKIIMSAIDWYNMWKANLNQSGMFYEERPLQLFGKQVVLVDDALKPVVGDFQYARINYDIASTYDTDKDVDSGVYKFVLTAWYDIKLRMKSAFRIAAAKTT